MGHVYFSDIRSFIYRKLRSLKYKKYIDDVHKHYDEVALEIKNKKEKLRVGAYVVFDSTFGAYKLFELMYACPEKYIAKIVIIPDIARGCVHQREQYQATKAFFVKKYGKDNVLDGFDESENKFVDYSEAFDIIYLANPYDSMVNLVHGIRYLCTKNCLPVYISYACMPDKYSCDILIPLLEISLFWKVFADNQHSYKDYKKYELFHGKNVILSGYAKMDSLINFIEKPRLRKSIVIAPHHTINNSALPLSNFLKYYDFFLRLPILFPEIDFIFRPHPLLFINMINEGYWTQGQVSEYLDNMKKRGVVYSGGGDYLDIFVNSDAIIHDCSSFIVEYLYTKKPCCFMMKKENKNVFSSLGKECLKNYYLAYSEENIISFIQDVVIDGVDSLKSLRERYAKDYLMENYPNVSEKILEEITL